MASIRWLILKPADNVKLQVDRSTEQPTQSLLLAIAILRVLFTA